MTELTLVIIALVALAGWMLTVEARLADLRWWSEWLKDSKKYIDQSSSSSPSAATGPSSACTCPPNVVVRLGSTEQYAKYPRHLAGCPQDNWPFKSTEAT